MSCCKILSSILNDLVCYACLKYYFVRDLCFRYCQWWVMTNKVGHSSRWIRKETSVTHRGIGVWLQSHPACIHAFWHSFSSLIACFLLANLCARCWGYIGYKDTHGSCPQRACPFPLTVIKAVLYISSLACPVAAEWVTYSLLVIYIPSPAVENFRIFLVDKDNGRKCLLPYSVPFLTYVSCLSATFGL